MSKSQWTKGAVIFEVRCCQFGLVVTVPPIVLLAGGGGTLSFDNVVKKKSTAKATTYTAGSVAHNCVHKGLQAHKEDKSVYASGIGSRAKGAICSPV